MIPPNTTVMVAILAASFVVLIALLAAISMYTVGCIDKGLFIIIQESIYF